VLANLRDRLREARAKRARLRGTLPGGAHLTLPWEHDAEEIIDKTTQVLQDVDDATSCDLGSRFAAGGAVYYQGKAAKVAATVSGAAEKLAFRLSVVSFALGVAGKAGFC